MTSSQIKRIAIIAIVLLAVVGFVIVKKITQKEPVKTIEAPKIIEPVRKVIGKSVENRDIEAYEYGNGKNKILFVGGVHGGYEWNSSLLAYEFMDYLKQNPDFISKDFTVAIIPSLNPDGTYAVTGKVGIFSKDDVVVNKETLAGLGRFNANNVDLNRNFDCKWKSKSTWKSKTVSAGTKAFSEPESEALRVFVSEFSPDSVIFWHSQSNAVYASECKNGILPETLKIMDAYSSASGYPPIKSFSAYEVSGDAEGWLASINIPAITVELKTHEDVEFDNNLSGIKALLDYYDNKKVSGM